MAQRPGNVGEQCGRIAITHAIEAVARPDLDADAIGDPASDCGIHDLEQETRPVLDAAVIAVGSVVRAILQELVDEIAVRRVDLDAVEARFLCAFGGPVVLRDDFRNFARFDGPRLWRVAIRRLQQRARTALERRRRDRLTAVRLQLGVRSPADVPELKHDLRVARQSG